MDPLGIFAMKETNRHLYSARPDAPVVRDRPSSAGGSPVRVGLARWLRRVADQLEPRRVTVVRRSPTTATNANGRW